MPIANPGIDLEQYAHAHPEMGVLWWNADSEEDYMHWVPDLVQKGCVLLKIDLHGAPFSQINVVFAVNKADAPKILGYVPEEEEWLDLSADTAITS